MDEEEKKKRKIGENYRDDNHYRRFSDKPHFVPQDYKTKFKEKISEDLGDGDFLESKYRGTGVKIEDHPLKGSVYFWNYCQNCGSDDLKVIYARHIVSQASGNAYFDYEVHCNKCDKFTQHSFSDN